MIRPAAKWLISAASVLAITAGLCAPTEAGVIPSFYNFIFGPSYPSAYDAGYGGTTYGASYGGTTYGVGYGGMRGCAPCGLSFGVGMGCAPCGNGCNTGSCGPLTYGGSCAPCNVGCAQYGPISCSPCAPGSANLTPTPAAAAPSAPTPAASDDGWRSGAEAPMPRTYAEPIPEEAPLNNTSAGPATTPEAPRTVPDPGFVPANRKPADPADVDAFRVPESRPATPINPRGTTPSINDEDDKDASHGPILNLDEKVAWRPAVERQRLNVKPNYANARLVRTPSYPRTDWVPASAESKVAKK